MTINGGGSLTASAWDGTSGGIVAFRATGSVAINAGASIDASALGRVPEPGAAWGFNMNRERPSSDPREYQCWSNTGGAFHTPERFGRIVFAGAFSKLRRIELIEASRHAMRSLELEQALFRNMRLIERMWGRLPSHEQKKHAAAHAELTRTWQQLRSRYGGRQRLTPAQWWAFTQGLDRACAKSDQVAWACRFHELLNE